MSERQTRNVSLTSDQDRFVEEMVTTGRYRTASEVLREGLRLLERDVHRRLLEKWLYDGLSDQEEEQLPQALKDRAKAHFAALIEKGMDDLREGRTVDGSTTMTKLREDLENKKR